MKLTTRTCMAAFAIASLTIWSSCTKTSHTEVERTSLSSSEEINITGTDPNSSAFADRTPVNSIPLLCGTPVVKNFIKNGIVYGSIQVGNDATNYYITVSGNAGWQLKDLRLYTGTEAGIPVNGGGLPKHADFPSHVFSVPYPSTQSFQIPIADLGDNFWVSVRANFISGGSEQALWSEGILFASNNAASKFSYIREQCIVDEGCAFGQGYWFGNGNLSWPDVNGVNTGHVTIGAEYYTRDEPRAIWWANNGLCPGIPNAKKAFAFVAAIRLSDANVIGNATLWSDMATIDAWLESLERLTPENICSHPDASATVMAAVARLGDWMDEHDCD